MNTKSPKWDQLQTAQFHLFEAAKHAMQAMTLHGSGHPFSSYEDLCRADFERAAQTLGFKLVKNIPQDDPDALDVFVDRINAIALGGR